MDKYWFAARSEKSWEATWGRRSFEPKGQSKTYSFDSTAKCTADYERKVKSKLAKGYEYSQAGRDAARIEGKKAFIPRLFEDKSKGTAHDTDRFGGRPIKKFFFFSMSL